MSVSEGSQLSTDTMRFPTGFMQAMAALPPGSVGGLEGVCYIARIDTNHYAVIGPETPAISVTSPTIFAVTRLITELAGRWLARFESVGDTLVTFIRKDQAAQTTE